MARLWLVLRVVVAIGAMAWVFRGQNWTQLGKTFQALDVGRLAFSVVVFMLSQTLLATRWWLLLRAQAIHTSLWTAVKLHLLGLFYNNVMPSAMGGDLLRAWYVSKYTDRRLAAALSVLVDRVIALLSMLVMVGFIYVCIIRGRVSLPSLSDQPKSPGAGGLMVGTLAILGVVLLAVYGILRSYPPTRRALQRHMEAAWRHLGAAAKTLGEAAVLYGRRPFVVLAAMALTILLQSLIVTAFWVLGRSLGIDAPLSIFFVAFPASWLFAAIPVSIAGIGLMEGALVVLLVHLAAVPEEQAKALALCQRFVWLLASVPGGFIHLLGAHLPKANSFDDRSSAG